MKGKFDGKSKWDAARETADALLAGLDAGANYDLVVLGGSRKVAGTDSCNEPAFASLPFASPANIGDHLAQIQPDGGGSLYRAFMLGRGQLEALPENTVQSLIFITGGTDSCTRDEWNELNRQFQFSDDAGTGFYTEIIVVNEKDNPVIQAVASLAGVRFKDIVFNFPHTNSELQQTTGVVLDNINKRVANALETTSTQTPFVSSFTLTPKPGALTNTPGASSYTITPKPGTATFTPTVTFTPAPRTSTSTLTPTITRTPTATKQPFVELISASYRTRGIGCQADITLKVSGSAATGFFHVMNAGNAPDGEVSEEIILPAGSYNNNIITLTGNQPDYYFHEVWFEYNGIQSNHLKNLKCPFAPTATPKP
jgi:hypothetical protein